ncbi:hypothetical protein [Pseudogemmobacter blasticus]|uniref:hypothetical protein n=1 Tax=Fuscovulum blasticum TaxID=1075 RepID=UPI0015E72D27|nr:hypothetical protein [Fuscovulum blasticum]
MPLTISSLTAADYRAMADAARRATNLGRVSGEAVVDLGRTNLRVRFSGGTYIARAGGITASCTAGPVLAMRAWATKAEEEAQRLEAAS